MLELDRRRKGQPSNGIVNNEKMNVNVHNVAAATAKFQRLCVHGPCMNAGRIHQDASLWQRRVHGTFLQAPHRNMHIHGTLANTFILEGFF